MTVSSTPPAGSSHPRHQGWLEAGQIRRSTGLVGPLDGRLKPPSLDPGGQGAAALNAVLGTRHDASRGATGVALGVDAANRSGSCCAACCGKRTQDGQNERNRSIETGFRGEDDGIRTRDLHLGKVAL